MQDKDGVAVSPAAPFVYWDGYGTGNAESGVGFYARALARALAVRGITPQLVADAQTRRAFAELPGITLPAAGIWQRVLASKPVWPLRVRSVVAEIAKRRSSPVVLHGLSNFNLPLLELPRNVRTVLTVHDVIPFFEPDGVSTAYLLQLKALLPRAMARAERVVCVSNWTQRTLAELYPDFAKKLVVVKNGCLPFRGRATRLSPERVRLLYVARHEGYKRVPFFCDILRKRRGEWRGTLVTNAAGVAWAESEARDLISDGTLFLRTRLDADAYAACFREASVYVSTSRLEGFCLPAAEALTNVVPVVYEEGSGLDEVAGRDVAVALRSGLPADEWIAAIEGAHAMGLSSDYEERARHHVAGLPTWNDAADALESVYNDLTSIPH